MKKTNAVAALAALAQETRLDIFRLLVRAGGEGLPAGEIAERLRVPAPTLSFHLNQLKQARLVTCRRDSRSLIYAAMNGLVGYLTENCCGGVAPGAEAQAACAPGGAVCGPGRQAARAAEPPAAAGSPA